MYLKHPANESSSDEEGTEREPDVGKFDETEFYNTYIYVGIANLKSCTFYKNHHEMKTVVGNPFFPGENCKKRAQRRVGGSVRHLAMEGECFPSLCAGVTSVHSYVLILRLVSHIF